MTVPVVLMFVTMKARLSAMDCTMSSRVARASLHVRVLHSSERDVVSMSPSKASNTRRAASDVWLSPARRGGSLAYGEGVVGLRLLAVVCGQAVVFFGGGRLAQRVSKVQCARKRAWRERQCKRGFALRTCT